MAAAAVVLLLLWRSAAAGSWYGEAPLYHEGSRTVLSPHKDAFFFGYSVLLQDSKPPRLVVGAPGSENNRIRHSGAPLYGAGEVYACPLNLQRAQPSSAPCAPDVHYYDGSTEPADHSYSPYIAEMYLGATLTDVYDGSLIVCAPNWVRHIDYHGKHPDERSVNGLCYVVSPHNQQNGTLIPLADPDRQLFPKQSTLVPYFAHGQAGFSSAVSRDKHWLLLGAPGVMIWTGGVVKYKLNDVSGNVGDSMISLKPTTNPSFTKSLKQDSYFGYAVAAGIFDESGETLGVAGAPRSRELLGEVYVFGLGGNESDPLDVRANLPGSQLGEYFGAALLVADVNGDGREDLLVGAPLRALPSAEKDCCYDQGAVYVYVNKKMEKGFELELKTTLTGSAVSGAKFGYALADLGDVDGDGFTDIAVGAPFEGPGGAGAVYVYRGGSLGVKDTYSQRIFPNTTELKGFGYSIAPGVDIDRNGCKDLAVGSVAGSDWQGGAAVFRCAPTLRVRGSIELLDVSTSRVRAGVLGVPRDTTALKAQFCARTDPAARWPAAARDVHATTEVQQTPEKFDLTAKSGGEACHTRTIALNDSIVKMKLSLQLQPVSDPVRDGSTFDLLYARLSNDSTLNTSLEVYFIEDCGDDMICTPDLKMSFTSLSGPRFVPGLDERIGVTVLLKNDGESAYGACVKMALPFPPLRTPSDCSLDGKRLQCDLPVPFLRHAAANWTIELQKGANLTEQDLLFAASVYESCDENVTQKLDLTIRVERIANITVVGMTAYRSCEEHCLLHSTFRSSRRLHLQENVHVATEVGTLLMMVAEAHERRPKPFSNFTVARASLSGEAKMEFAHSFEVKNYGPSDWSNVKIEFTLSPKVSLSEHIPECAYTSPSKSLVQCWWSLRALESRTALLRLVFDVPAHESELRAEGKLQITTRFDVIYGNTNKSVEVSTLLYLEPRPAIWPIIVAVLLGLLLIALIVFIMYKTGFFKRSKKHELRQLRESTAANEGLTATTRRASTSASDLLDEESTAMNTSEPVASNGAAAALPEY